ncbi:peptidoglycan DD-metalloendopeptidase family protein [Streptomyces rubrogriseus]|uniref:peptidoglycan DD-metalloendopeptidase family protein n=1 Tax=Streptomyces rubrogriseus TaxID=194673 RepID=UPI003658906D
MAGNLDIVGTVGVDVVPVAPHLHEKLKAIALPAAQRVGEEAGRRFGDAMSRHITVAIPQAINNGGNAARNASTRAGNDNAGAFGRAFKARLEAAFKSLPKPDVRLGTTGFEADLARVRSRLESLSGKRIGIDVDADTALAEMQAIDAKLSELGSRSPNIQVRSDIATARAQLAEMQRQVNDLDRDDVNIRVRAHTGPAHAALLQLAIALGAVAAIPVIPVAVAGIGAIVSAATVAAAGVGSLALVAVPAIKSVTSVITAKSAAEKEATSATNAGAAANVQAAQRAMQAASAQASLRNAHRQAAKQIEQSNRAVEDAERALGRAAAQAMEQRRQAAEAVERAEKQLADAKRESLRAEEGLTRARKDAAQQLEDLQDRLTAGALDERDAALRVQEAQEELNRVQADPTATDLQRQRAQLAVDEALQGQKDQTKSYKRLQAEAAAAAKAGVDGNEDVKRASEAVVTAQNNVREQTEAVADAQRDAAQAQADAAQSVADAQRSLADAVDNAADAQVSAAESIATAERGVESARLSGVNTTAQAASAADKYREALAKLTPEQRQLYESLAGSDGLIAAYKEWAKSLSPDVLPLFTRMVDGAKRSLPGLTPLVKNSARAVGDLMDRAGRELKNPFWTRFKKGVTESAEPAIEGMGVSFGNVLKGMAGVVDAFLPHMDGISRRMQDITGRFANWGTNLRGSPEFEAFLDYASDRSPLVAETFGDLAEALLDLAKALEPFSEVVLEAISMAADGISYVSEHAPWAIQSLYGLWVATKLWSLAMAASPIGRIILGLFALAGAVKYAWSHYEWFRDTVKGAWEGIQVAADFAWNKVLRPTFEGIWGGLKWLGEKAMWLWQEIFKPVWDGIVFAAKLAFAILVTAVLTPIWLAIKLVGAIALWLWTDCFRPTWEGISGGAKWLWFTILKPIFQGIWDGIKWLGDKALWLYNNAVKPMADWVAEKSKWLWETILKPVFQAIWDGIKWVGEKFQWLYNHSVKPVVDWIADKAGWLWSKALKPAFDKIKDAVGLVGEAFGAAKDAIRSAWNQVAGIAAKPVNFLIDFVYTNGVKKIWDSVADLVSLPKLPKAPKLLDEDPKFATGGRVFGGTPGKDSVRAWLMPGEYVVKTDSARGIGYDALEHMNRTGELPGIPKFADGGVVGAASGVWDWTKNIVSSSVDFLTNPGAAWSKAMKPILDKVRAGVGDTPMADYLAKIPGKMVSGLKDKIVSAATSFFGGRGGAPRVGSGEWALPVNAAPGTRFGVPGSMWSSGYHTGLDFPAMTGTPIRSVDDGRVSQATSGGPYGRHVLIDHGKGLSSLYAHMSQIAVKVGQDVIRGQGIGKVGATGNVTGPHLHLEARLNGRTVNPEPYLFDNGGFLPPGLSLVSNQTREPEPILTADQWGMISKLYGQRGDAQSHRLTSQQLADISAAKSGGASPVYNEVRVFMGDREITDVVRTEINTYDSGMATDLNNGRWI